MADFVRRRIRAIRNPQNREDQVIRKQKWRQSRETSRTCLPELREGKMLDPKRHNL